MTTLDAVGWFIFGLMFGLVAAIVVHAMQDYFILKRIAARHAPIDRGQALDIIREAANLSIPVIVYIDGEGSYAYQREQALFEITLCGKVRWARNQ